MDIKEKMAGRIKDLREERCLTQKDLAYSSNLDRSYIADVERGMRNIYCKYRKNRKGTEHINPKTIY